MSNELVDEHGNPISTAPPDVCPNCGAAAKHLEEFQMFGGHHRLICKKCGHTIKSWRD